MVQEYLDPNGNSTSVWVSNAYTSIDDAVREPNDPGTATSIYANKSDDSEEQTYTMSNTVETYGAVTQIVIWVNGMIVAGTPEITCRISVGGSWETAQNMGLTTSQAWHSYTFNGSWSAANVDALLVSFITPNMPGSLDLVTIYCAYADISGTAPGAGTNMKINIADTWKAVDNIKINIADSWKAVSSVKQNIGDVWKTVF